MYRAIGFLVVAGFALFGASKFIEDHVVLDGEDPDQLKGAPTTVRLMLCAL